MRIPKINNYSSIGDTELRVIPNMEFVRPSYILYDEKARTKFIKKVEKIVRSSHEYRELIAYLHSGLDMNYCMFFNNVSKDKGRRVGIEIHHLPFSLFDIVNIILKKYEEEEIPFDPLIIAEEVMQCHYKGHVGLVPLSTTVHQLYHRGDIFIPLQYVDKGFLCFYQEYKPYLKDYEEMLKRLIILSKDFDLGKNSILRKHLIYLNNIGYESTPMKIK